MVCTVYTRYGMYGIHTVRYVPYTHGTLCTAYTRYGMYRIHTVQSVPYTQYGMYRIHTVRYVPYTHGTVCSQLYTNLFSNFSLYKKAKRLICQHLQNISQSHSSGCTFYTRGAQILDARSPRSLNFVLWHVMFTDPHYGPCVVSPS